ncbi:MAG: hypothetical protein ABIZ04_11875 [Opitutus sp.]
MRLCLLVGLLLTSAPGAWALSANATRAEVIAELGKPSSSAMRGVREILLYPKGVRLELEAGRVVSAQGLALAEPPPRIAEPVASKEQLPAPAAKAPLVEKEKPEPIEPDFVEKAETGHAASNSQAQLEKSFESLVAQQEQAQRTPHQQPFDVIGFLFENALKFLMTVGALKLACRYWGAEVFWNGILTVAAVDAVVRGAMQLAGELWLGFPSLFYADDAVGALFMVLLLKKLSINQSTGQAIQLTLTTKTFTVLVGAFLVTIILRLRH